MLYIHFNVVLWKIIMFYYMWKFYKRKNKNIFVRNLKHEILFFHIKWYKFHFYFDIQMIFIIIFEKPIFEY